MDVQAAPCPCSKRCQQRVDFPVSQVDSTIRSSTICSPPCQGTTCGKCGRQCSNCVSATGCDTRPVVWPLAHAGSSNTSLPLPPRPNQARGSCDHGHMSCLFWSVSTMFILSRYSLSLRRQPRTMYDPRPQLNVWADHCPSDFMHCISPRRYGELSCRYLSTTHQAVTYLGCSGASASHISYTACVCGESLKALRIDLRSAGFAIILCVMPYLA